MVEIAIPKNKYCAPSVIKSIPLQHMINSGKYRRSNRILDRYNESKIVGQRGLISM